MTPTPTPTPTVPDTPAITVTGKNVKDGSLTSVDVKNQSLTGHDVKNGSLGVTDFAPGQLPADGQGAPGADGSKGDTGPQGTQGPQGDPGTAPDLGTSGTFLITSKPLPTAATHGAWLAQAKNTSSTATTTLRVYAMCFFLQDKPLRFTGPAVTVGPGEVKSVTMPCPSNASNDGIEAWLSGGGAEILPGP